MSTTAPPWLSAGALLRAWELVNENHGCAGVDGITVDRFATDIDASLESLRVRVGELTYRALPLLPVTIPKKPGSMATRTLLIPAVRDRILQTAVAHHLGQALEDEFLDCSFAYRPHRSVSSAVARIRYLHAHGFRYVAAADIESFFDRIDHELLRQRLESRIGDPLLSNLIAGWISAYVWNGHAVNSLRAGVPQGSPISPLLANGKNASSAESVGSSALKEQR